MSVLARYVSREFLRLFGLCLGALIVIYLVFDFIDRAGNFFRSDPAFVHVLLYFLYKIPTIVFQLLPVSVLLSTLLVLAIMSRNSEITAMKAGGVSVPTIVLPILLWSLVLAGGAFAINEFVVPAATTKMKYVKKVYIKKQEWRVKIRDKDFWYKSPGAIYRIGRFRPEENSLHRLQIYRFDEGFSLRERIDAERAVWADDQWRAVSGVVRKFDRGRLLSESAFEEQAIDLPETPEDLLIYRKDPEQMGVRDLLAYINDLKSEGFDVRKYRVDLHGKISFSLVTAIMALLGIPWAIRSGRQGGVAFGIGLAVIIGVVYWIVLGFALALGRSGALPVLVAAWGPHVLFGVAGIVALIRTRS
ncbi:MAG: LPS export ABC transporter permease LptG [Candidatus Lernaella stagnicola]|nr:LPS export ABC transporter permease LptG [Candidatus Lernaella stagnicola]